MDAILQKEFFCALFMPSMKAGVMDLCQVVDLYHRCIGTPTELAFDEDGIFLNSNDIEDVDANGDEITFSIVCVKVDKNDLQSLMSNIENQQNNLPPFSLN